MHAVSPDLSQNQQPHRPITGETVDAAFHRVPRYRPDMCTSWPARVDGPAAMYMTHMFGMRCRENGIEHRLTKIKQMKRTVGQFR